MKILLWSIGGAGAQYGGPGMTAYKMYSKNTNKNIEIYLAHASADQNPIDDVFAGIYFIGRNNYKHSSQIEFLYRAKKWLELNAKKFDVFHGLQGFNTTVYPAAWFKEITGRPSVIKLAAYNSDLANNSLVLQLLGNYRRRRKTAKKLDGIIAISKDIRDELLQYGFDASKIFSVGNGVDSDKYKPIGNAERIKLREKLGMSKLPVVVFMGGINARKQPSRLVEAIAVLEGLNIICQLYLLGPINEKNELAKIKIAIGGMSNPENVVITEFVENADDYLKASDLFALISTNEGMSNAVLEAMACGVLVLSTSISGTRDLIVNGENGVLVAPDIGAADLAECIGRIIKNDHEQMKNRSLALVRANYDAKIILKKHIQVFESMVKM